MIKSKAEAHCRDRAPFAYDSASLKRVYQDRRQRRKRQEQPETFRPVSEKSERIKVKED